MRILGIDPALAAVGYAMVWQGEEPADLELLEYDTFTTPAKTQEGYRLLLLRRWLEAFLEVRQPNVLAIERPGLAGRAYANGLPLGMAYGVILCCAQAAGLRVVEYTPQTVKLWAAGSGRAQKPAVRAAIKARFGDGLKGRDDGFDAVAVALTHALKGAEEVAQMRGAHAGR